MPLHVQACWRNGGATQFRGSIPEQRLDRAGKEFGLGVGGGGLLPWFSTGRVLALAFPPHELERKKMSLYACVLYSGKACALTDCIVFPYVLVCFSV